MIGIQPFSQDKLFKLLANRIEKTEIVSITELEQSAQLVQTDKRFYKLKLSTDAPMHLTISNQYSKMFEKAKILNSLFPIITCKPFFFESVDSYHLFAQEYFEGRPIHVSLEEGVISHEDVKIILLEIAEKFKGKIVDSTVNSLEEEIAEISSKVLETLGIKDKQIIELLILPLLSKINPETSIAKRWTNGDFAGRNILVNQNKDYKIIDYEFSKETHFYDEDWLRLSTYSSLEFQKNDFLKQKVSNLSSSTIAYHYLNQIYLDSIKSTQNEFRSIAGNLLLECLESIHNHSDDNSVITEYIKKLRKENFSQERELNIDKFLKQKLSAENEYLRSKIISIQDSLSWKLLAPLRRLQKRFRKDVPEDNRSEPGFLDQVNQNPEISIPQNSVSSTRSENKSLDWIIPDFDIGSGGHTTIFRIIKWLEKFGYRNNIWICGNSIHKSTADAKKVIEEHFFQLKANVYFLKKDKVVNLSSNGLICTSYHTCYYLSNFSYIGPRYYFVQDFEPNFYPIGTEYFLALDTYKIGLKCITAGSWLADEIKKVGAEVLGFFELAVDSQIFFHSPLKPLRHKPRIAVYSRSGTPRRLTELIILGLTILHNKGIPFHAEFFGEKKLPLKVKFSYDIHSVLTPTDLGKLYRRCDVGCVFSATNYSLVPLEMMACGLPVIEFDGKNTRRTYPQNTVHYSKPTPNAIYKAINNLLISDELRLENIKNGIEYVKSLSWEKSARMVAKALNK